MRADLCKFADFERDPSACQLRRRGRPVKLERIPLELLFLLAERHGELVTREEIRNRIWGKEVFLAADNSINTAVGKLRRVLRDHPGSPRYIATVPSKGYRFIATVHGPATQGVLACDPQTASPDDESKTSQPGSGPIAERRRLAVLFCDLTDASTRAVKGDREEWWAIVAKHHRAAVQAIERYGGHAGQYRGEGVMAYFGWPEAHDNNAENAVRAGLAILEVVSKLNQPATTRLQICPRIGIDSGAVVIGPGAGRKPMYLATPPISPRTCRLQPILARCLLPLRLIGWFQDSLPSRIAGHN